MIYLDYSANTPVDARVLEQFCAVERRCIGNANSHHQAGSAAKAEIDAATIKIASLLGVQPAEIIYTSGASEAGSDYSGKRKNFCKDTVESSHAEQTISSCIGRTDIIWIYIIWQKRRYSVLFYICGRKCLLLHNLFDVHHYSFYHRGSLFSTIIPQVE